MTTFNDREKGFENKFAHDEEMQFKAAARRNKLLGLWAAVAPRQDRRGRGRLRDGGGPGRLRRGRPRGRRAASSRPISTTAPTRATIRAKMSELLAVAKAQIIDETS